MPINAEDFLQYDDTAFRRSDRIGAIRADARIIRRGEIYILSHDRSPQDFGGKLSFFHRKGSRKFGIMIDALSKRRAAG
jgi:hypothetical protein